MKAFWVLLTDSSVDCKIYEYMHVLFTARKHKILKQITLSTPGWVQNKQEKTIPGEHKILLLLSQLDY